MSISPDPIHNQEGLSKISPPSTLDLDSSAESTSSPTAEIAGSVETAVAKTGLTEGSSPVELNTVSREVFNPAEQAASSADFVATALGGIKQMHLPEDAYAFSAPVVQIPESWNELSADEKEAKIQQCLDDYRIARKKMEKSIATVAAQDPGAMAFARELAQRIFDLVIAQVQMEFEDQHFEPVNRGTRFDLAVNKKLTELFGSEAMDEAGAVGMSPLSIRHAIESGNLRETMYIPYKATYRYTKGLFSNPDRVARLNAILEQRGCNWTIHTEFLDQVREATQDDEYGGIYLDAPITALSRTEKLREERNPVEAARIAEEVAKPINSKKRLTPLSSREIFGQTGEPAHRAAEFGLLDQKPKWRPGIAWIRPKTASEVNPNVQTYPYLQGVQALQAPEIGGISGTTDKTLTLAAFLGMSSPEDMQRGKLALLGWMVSEKDHSVHEIMIAGKAFGFKYNPRPDDYKDISDDPEFLAKVAAEQERRGYKLPDAYLKPTD